MNLINPRLRNAKVFIARDVIQNPDTLVGLLALLSSNGNHLQTLYVQGFFPLESVLSEGIIMDATVSTQPTELNGIVHQVVTMGT